VRCDLVEAYANDHQVQQQVSPDYKDCDADGLLKAFEEDSAKDRQEHQRD
jgi:hypothetical protein